MANLTEAEQQELAGLNARAGAAAPAPAATPAPGAPAAPQDDPEHGADQISPSTGDSGIGAVASDVAGGTLETPGAIVRGVAGAVASVGHGVADLLDAGTSTNKKNEEAGRPSDTVITPALADLKPIAKGVAWLGDAVRSIIPERQTVTGNLVEEVTQFSVGIAGMGKFIELPAMATTA